MNIKISIAAFSIALILPTVHLHAIEPFSLQAHCLATIVKKRNEIITPPWPVPDHINNDLTLLNRARVNLMYHHPDAPPDLFNEQNYYLTDVLNIFSKIPVATYTVPSLYSYALAHVLSKTIPFKTMQSLSLLCKQNKKRSTNKFHINGNIITNMVVLETLLLSCTPQERFHMSTDLIHQACRENHPMPLIKLLANRNPQKLINTVHSDSYTIHSIFSHKLVIEHAVYWNRTDLVIFLLSHGALVSESALTIAAENNHVNKEIIFALLDYGADFTGGKFSPLNIAQQKNNKKFIDAVNEWQNKQGAIYESTPAAANSSSASSSSEIRQRRRPCLLQ